MTFDQEFNYIALLILGILATFATVGLIFWLINSPRTGGLFRCLTSISPQVVAIIGLLFGLYMAFFANDIWSIRDRAQAMILQEADGLHSILDVAESLPAGVGAPLAAAVRSYAQAAVQEWPLLAQGKSSPQARELLRQLSHVALGEPLTSRLGPGIQYALVHNLEKAQSARYHRLALSQKRGDPLKWFAVACLGTLTLLTVALVHLDNWRSQLAAMLIYASAISVGFTAAYLERSPFQVFVVSPRSLAELSGSESPPVNRDAWRPE
ncbi:MAG: hypothetical protein U1F42_03290 [Candidatus Competibacteraceae bacterium]